MKTKNKPVAIFCILLILGALIFSIGFMLRNAGIRRTGNPAIATITHDDRDDVRFHIWRTVEFTTGGGHIVRGIEIWTPFGSVGDNVNIYYCSDNPRRIAMQNIEWGLVLIFLLTAPIIGLFVFFTVKRIYLKVKYE